MKDKHNTKYDVIIVGAGISGLYLASQLQKFFSKILIIEKSNRVGGRIFTNKQVIKGTEYILEEGAVRISKHHMKTMALINKLGLSKYLINDTDEISREYISSKLFNYDNNINLKNLFHIILDSAKNLKKKELENIKFRILCRHILDDTNYKLLNKLWKEYIKISRINYDGGGNKKFRMHPTYSGNFCKLDLSETNKVTRFTPYLHNYINLFKLDAFIGIRIIYTIFFNKNLNKYYKLSNGNISICDKLLDRFQKGNGEIIYNTKFIDFKYSKKEFSIELEGCFKKLKCKKLILAIPTKDLTLINKLNHLKPYLKDSIYQRLARVHAIYPKDNKTNRVWFDDIPWIVTDNVLRHIIPKDTKKGILLLAYLADNNKIAYYEKLYNCSPTICYNKLEKHLKKLFPYHKIPKPIYFSFKSWDGGTHAWKRDTDYCNIYQKIIFPMKNVSIYICNESYAYRGGWIEGALEIADEILDKILSSYKHRSS